MLRDKSYKKNVKSSKKPLFFQFFVVLSIFGSSCTSDLGKKNSREPVTAGAFGKNQQESLSDLLKKYVTEDRRINYFTWSQESNDLSLLDSIIRAFGDADVNGMSDSEKKSFYVNAYNAFTIDLILSNYNETLGGDSSPYPQKRSIRNIKNLDEKVWDEYKWKLNGLNISLNEIEHKLLRPMGDARIHFAIVCASKGCPPILNRAFSSENLDETLEQLSHEFVNSGRDTTFNVESNRIKTSKIIDWFASDFTKSFGSVGGFFSKYSKTVTSDQIKEMKISYFVYDWTLNEPDFHEDARGDSE